MWADSTTSWHLSLKLWLHGYTRLTWQAILNFQNTFRVQWMCTHMNSYHYMQHLLRTYAQNTHRMYAPYPKLHRCQQPGLGEVHPCYESLGWTRNTHAGMGTSSNSSTFKLPFTAHWWYTVPPSLLSRPWKSLVDSSIVPRRPGLALALNVSLPGLENGEMTLIWRADNEMFFSISQFKTCLTSWDGLQCAVWKLLVY